MFASLVKFLFPSLKKDHQANYFYFEDSKKSVAEMQKKAVDGLSVVLSNKTIDLATPEEKQQKAFYDYLFGQSPPTAHHDELSLYIAKKVDELIAKPHDILQVLPVLPASLSKVLAELNNPEFDTQELVELIQHEPAIAAKVIELANSPYYKRNKKDITDLKSAFMALGANGLMEGVINGFVSKLVPHSRVYYKQYADKIWEHSLSTGQIAKYLLNHSEHKQEAAEAYLIGLICNLGDLIIYQLMIDAFAFVHPDCQPNSFAFKDMMFKNSKTLAYHIVKYWQLPQSIIDALLVQVKLTKSTMLPVHFAKRPVPCFIYEANVLSELEIMFAHKQLSAQNLNEAKGTLVFSEQAKSYIDQLLEN